MSANFFEKLKRVNKESNLIVYGFLRECEVNIFGELSKSNAYYNFPEIMLNICLIYYHIMDKWDEKYIGRHHKLSKDGLRIENIRNGFGTSFGEETVSSPGKYHWRFKLEKVAPNTSVSDYWCIVLGVWKTNCGTAPVVNNYYTKCANWKGQYKYGYAYDITMGTLISADGGNAGGGNYGKRCKGGDIIELCLDFNAFTLKLIINGEDMGISHNEIEDTKYRVALCTFHTGSIIEMLP